MPRDSNGIYTLPAGNPVISGSVITPTWANPTMEDLGTEMTDSLSRSGSGGMLVPFEFTDGDEGNPGMAWVNEPSTGFYRAGGGDMRATVFGADSAQFTQDGIFQSDGDVGFNQVADARGFVFVGPDSRLLHDGNPVLFTSDGGIAVRASAGNPQIAIQDDTAAQVALLVASAGNFIVRSSVPGAAIRFEARNAADDANPPVFIGAPDGGSQMMYAGSPRIFATIDGERVDGSLMDLDNSGNDEVTIMRLRNAVGGFTLEQFEGPGGSLFLRQIDSDGSNPKNWGHFERDGAVSWRWNGLEMMRTRNSFIAGNAGLEVLDGGGVFQPVGYGVMPRVDVGASTVRVLTFADAGKRFRMQSATGVLQLADFGNEAAINLYCSAAAGVGAVIRVPATFILRYYGGSNGQINFNGPVDILIDGGSAFTIVQFTNTLWEMWGGNLL